MERSNNEKKTIMELMAEISQMAKELEREINHPLGFKLPNEKSIRELELSHHLGMNINIADNENRN